MRVDLYGLDDGVIEATANIPDALWTTDVKTAANASAADHGMGIDISANNDTIDPHVPTIASESTLITWINGHAYTAAKGVTAPAATDSPGAIQVVGAIVGATVAGGILWMAFRTIYPAWVR